MSAEPEERVIDDRMEEEEEDDKDLEAMKARVAEMEAEAAKLRELQAGLDASSGGVDAEAPTAEPEEAAAIDARSVYVGNVDYGATPEELQQHFLSCGTINRITILCHKPSGHPKGYAYIEFAEPAGAQNAVSSCNDSSFRQRPLSVVLKRTNVPGMGASSRARGRGARGGYRGGGFRGRGYGFNPYARGRGSRGRGRGF